jgi:hypothetical protein
LPQLSLPTGTRSWNVAIFREIGFYGAISQCRSAIWRGFEMQPFDIAQIIGLAHFSLKSPAMVRVATIRNAGKRLGHPEKRDMPGPGWGGASTRVAGEESAPSSKKKPCGLKTMRAVDIVWIG